MPTCTKQATHRGPSGLDARGKVTYRRLLCGSHKHSILTVDGDFVCYGRAPFDEEAEEEAARAAAKSQKKKKQAKVCGVKKRGRPKKSDAARKQAKGATGSGALSPRPSFEDTDDAAASLMLAAFGQAASAASSGRKSLPYSSVRMQPSTSIESPGKAAFPGTPNQPIASGSTSATASSLLLQQQQQQLPQQQQYFNMQYALSSASAAAVATAAAGKGGRMALKPLATMLTPGMYAPHGVPHGQMVMGSTSANMHSSPLYPGAPESSGFAAAVSAAAAASPLLSSSSSRKLLTSPP